MDPQSKAHLVISRDADLCSWRCRTGYGTKGHMERAIFCKCVGTTRYLSKLYCTDRLQMGWVVDNPDIADPADATMRSYMQKQRRKHNDEKERAHRNNYNYSGFTRPCWAQQRHSQRPDEDEEPDYPPIGYLHV